MQSLEQPFQPIYCNEEIENLQDKYGNEFKPWSGQQYREEPLNENSRDSKEDPNFDLLPDAVNIDQLMQEMNQSVMEEHLATKQRNDQETPISARKPLKSAMNSRVFMKLHN